RSLRWVRKWLPKARWKRALLAVTGLCLVAGMALFWRLYRKVDEFLAGQVPGPIRIYADATTLRPGVNVEGAHLLLRLRRLGYEEVSGLPRQPGSFRADRDRIEIALRRFADPDGEHRQQIVRLDLSRSVVETIRDVNGRDIGQAAIEPELLGTYTGGVLGERRVFALDDFPRHVVSAVLAAEDARFATHPGIDPLGLLRAVWVDFRGGGVRQGGSTITQQRSEERRCRERL